MTIVTTQPHPAAVCITPIAVPTVGSSSAALLISNQDAQPSVARLSLNSPEGSLDTKINRNVQQRA